MKPNELIRTVPSDAVAPPSCELETKLLFQSICGVDLCLFEPSVDTAVCRNEPSVIIPPLSLAELTDFHMPLPLNVAVTSNRDETKRRSGHKLRSSLVSLGLTGLKIPDSFYSARL